MSEQMLRQLKKASEQALKKQTQEGLAKVFSKLSCKGVAKEIKAGRNVVGNVEYGIRLCLHDKLGPRVNVETMKFTPMSAKSKNIERNFLRLTNKLLKNGGFREISPKLLSDLAKKDKAFERKIAERRKSR